MNKNTPNSDTSNFFSTNFISTYIFSLMTLLLFLLSPLTASAQRSGFSIDPKTFLDDDHQVEIVEQGKGWQRLSVSSLGQPNLVPQEIWAVWPDGISAVPISSAQKQELFQDFGFKGKISAGKSTEVIVIHKDIADAMEAGESLAPWAEYAEVDPNSFGCSGWKTKTKTEDWSFDEINEQQDFNLGSNISGNISLHLPVQGQATLELTYSYKRNSICIPYKFRFDQAHIFGNMTVTGDSLLDAGFTLQGHWEGEHQVMNPRIGRFDFWVGIIPVRVELHMPVDIGYVIDATLQGDLSVAADLSTSGNFDYTCTKDDCWGSNDFGDLFDEDGVTGSLELDATANLWARIKLRASLYDDDFLYAEAGLKGYLEANLWGYYGNNCGDGDGDGQNELVEALTAGVDAGYDLTFGYGGILGDDEWIVTGDRFYLGWWDLLGYGGSTALSPMIEGPSLVTVGVPTEYTIRMRPCYPYSEPVTFGMAPGNWSGDFTLEDPATSSETTSKIFGSPIAYDLRAMTVRDSKGRIMHVPQWRRIWAQNPVPPPALVLSYVPSAGAARQTHRSTDSNPTPAAKSFYYDPALGNFEERLEGACTDGSNNPTYVKVKYDGPTIQSCTFKSHVENTLYTCPASLVSDLNSGKEIILNTDSYEVNPSTCNLSNPLSAVCTPGKYCWITANMMINGEEVSRTVAYRK